MKKIYILTILILMAVVAYAAKAKTFTLVIDAGHGGHDAGAIGAITKEKTINLNVALAFGRMVESNCKDVKVIYTRKTDVFVPLHTRADIANKAKADLFISIHTNALPKKRISRGMETYTLGMHRAADNLDVAKRENSVILIEKDYKQHYEGFDPKSPESNILFELVQDKNLENSIQLAKFMQKNICSATGRQDKGVYQDNLAVLRLTSMPACLMELGFISTPDEEQYMNSDRALQQYTRGFYNAFVAYKNKVAPNIKVPYKPATELPEPAQPEKPAEKVEEPADNTLAQSQPAPQPLLSQPVADEPPAETATAGDAPVFKVQILTSGSVLKPGNRLLKGHTDAAYYREGGIYKYTVGASTNYQEIYRLRKEVLPKFPEAFIIAFRGDKKMDVNEAIREYKNNKVKRS